MMFDVWCMYDACIMCDLQAAEALKKKGRAPPQEKQWWEKELEGGQGEEEEERGARKRAREEGRAGGGDDDDEDDDVAYFKWVVVMGCWLGDYVQGRSVSILAYSSQRSHMPHTLTGHARSVGSLSLSLSPTHTHTPRSSCTARPAPSHATRAGPTSKASRSRM